MKKIVIILSLLISMMACQEKDMNKIEFKHQELFNIPKETESFIMSNNEYKDLKNNLIDFKQYKNYYIAHGKGYQKDYSSTVDNEAIRIACIEYLMGKQDYLLQLTPEQRKGILCLALEKQKIKFDIQDSNPTIARQTGLVLIIRLLSMEKEETILRSISDYCDKHQFQYGVYNDTGFNDFLLKLGSTYCND